MLKGQLTHALEHGGPFNGYTDIRNLIAMSCTLQWLKTIKADVICHTTQLIVTKNLSPYKFGQEIVKGISKAYSPKYLSDLNEQGYLISRPFG